MEEGEERGGEGRERRGEGVIKISTPLNLVPPPSPSADMSTISKLL